MLNSQVQRLYLNDLQETTDLPLSLALLRLIVLPEAAVADAAKQVLTQAKGQGEVTFQSILNSLEAILINRFPQFTTQEILAMLDLTMADIRQTRSYQEVYQEGREEGREEGEAAVLLRLLARRVGPLPEAQVAHI